VRVRSLLPFQHGTFVLPDPAGADTLVLCVKGTFAVERGNLRVATEQAPLVLADEYHGEPGASSLRYASDVSLPKPATDVAIVGSAFAPKGQPERRFACSAAVGKLRKVAHVLGDRVWKKGVFGVSATAPEPALEVPLVFERAFGGSRKLDDGTVVAEPRNPVGCGLKARRSRAELAGLPVPNLLAANEPLDQPADAGTPVGFGFVAPSWEPRRSRAGTYDAAWEEERAPFLPADFDPRYFQAAAEGLVYPGRFQGGEAVELVNLAPPPHTALRFRLPCCAFDVKVKLGREVLRPRLELDTIVIEPHLFRLGLVWRAAVPCHDRFHEIEGIQLAVAQLEGAEG
jgi:hypothetical protein